MTLYAAIDGGSVQAVAYKNRSSACSIVFGEKPSHEWLPMAVDLLAMTSGACRVRVEGGLKVKVKRSGVLKVPTMKFILGSVSQVVLCMFGCAASIACIRRLLVGTLCPTPEPLPMLKLELFKSTFGTGPRTSPSTLEDTSEYQKCTRYRGDSPLWLCELVQDHHHMSHDLHHIHDVLGSHTCMGLTGLGSIFEKYRFHAFASVHIGMSLLGMYAHVITNGLR